MELFGIPVRGLHIHNIVTTFSYKSILERAGCIQLLRAGETRINQGKLDRI